MVTARHGSGNRLAIDIGGTFTDLVLVVDGGLAAMAKTLTTPADPSQGVVKGIAEILDQFGGPIDEVVHGTTLVSNALIERALARTAFVTTRGFRDVLSIGREHRYDLYDLSLEMPAPLVPRHLRWEVAERVLSDGSIVQAPSREEVHRIARHMKRLDIESVAVGLIHSYVKPEHERMVGRALREELPGIPISLSSEVCPELGELPRFTTTAANAAVLPLMAGYLGRLSDNLASMGIQAPVHVMLSTGDLADVELGSHFPVRMCESGPAAGVLSAAFSAQQGGFEDLVAFDMGGTTAKACIVEGGRPRLAEEMEVGRIHRFIKGSGLPLRVPVIDLIEIGAGGGSIARVDMFGLLKVGPASAGADPGPACYGQGGIEPTVTDADLLLGYLSPDYFLGGRMALDVGAAESALGRLAEGLGVGPVETALGVHRVVNEEMAAAVRMHAAERGRDLRRLTLVATGGAGPVHAWGLARALGIKRILYPPAAGVASAYGMLTAPVAFTFVRSLPALITEVKWSEVRSELEAMKTEGFRVLARCGLDVGVAQTKLWVDMRHRGQGEAVRVELGHWLPEGDQPAAYLEQQFELAYLGLYARRPQGVEVEVLTWRLQVSGPTPGLSPPKARTPSRLTKKPGRPMWSLESGQFVEADVISRYDLESGTSLTGPMIIEERESTVIIGGGGRATVDSWGNLEVTVDA